MCHNDYSTKDTSVVHKGCIDQGMGMHQRCLGVCLERGKAQQRKCLLEAVEGSKTEACS